MHNTIHCKTRNCHYYWVFVTADSDEWTKVIKSGGECISSCIFNLSAHSHTINIIVNYQCIKLVDSSTINVWQRICRDDNFSFYCEGGARHHTQCSVKLCILYIAVKLQVLILLLVSYPRVQASSDINSMYRTISWTWPCGVPVFCAKYVVPSSAEVGHIQRSEELFQMLQNQCKSLELIRTREFGSTYKVCIPCTNM